MWGAITGFIKDINWKPKKLKIDNWVFRLHYQITFWSLVVATTLILGSTFFEGQIRCGANFAVDTDYRSKEDMQKFANEYCLRVGAFTVPRHYVKNNTNREVPYAGVGPKHGKEPIERAMWYQWVPFVLFIQALSFYIPHLIWRRREGRTLSEIIKGIDVLEMRDEVAKKKILNDVYRNMLNRIEHYPPWTNWLFICEILNLVNLAAQWRLNDWFLRGNFSLLGYALTEDENDTTKFSILDTTFPKITKCTLKTFGPSGGIQERDMFCVMTLNMIYEKLYLVLWYWYIVLMTLSAMAVIHRIIAWTTHRFQYHSYNLVLLKHPLKIANNADIYFLMSELTYSQWNFVLYLCSNVSNLDGTIAKSIMEHLAKSIREKRLKSFNESVKHKQSMDKVTNADDSAGIWLLFWRVMALLQQGA